MKMILATLLLVSSVSMQAFGASRLDREEQESLKSQLANIISNVELTCLSTDQKDTPNNRDTSLKYFKKKAVATLQDSKSSLTYNNMGGQIEFYTSLVYSNNNKDFLYHEFTFVTDKAGRFLIAEHHITDAEFNEESVTDGYADPFIKTGDTQTIQCMITQYE